MESWILRASFWPPPYKSLCARRLYGKRPSKARAFTGVSNWEPILFLFLSFFFGMERKMFTIPRLTVRCPGASGICQSNFFFLPAFPSLGNIIIAPNRLEELWGWKLRRIFLFFQLGEREVATIKIDCGDVPAKKETMTIAHESQHRFFFYAGKISFYFTFYLIFFFLSQTQERKHRDTNTGAIQLLWKKEGR